MGAAQVDRFSLGPPPVTLTGNLEVMGSCLTTIKSRIFKGRSFRIEASAIRSAWSLQARSVTERRQSIACLSVNIAGQRDVMIFLPSISSSSNMHARCSSQTFSFSSSSLSASLA